MLATSTLEETVQKTVTLYNRLKAPEAFAKVIQVTQETVTISFSGSFCYSCGVLDYIEDFIRDFKILTDKYELKIGKTWQTSPRSFEVDYKVKTR